MIKYAILVANYFLSNNEIICIYNYEKIIYSYRIEKALMTNIVNKITLKDEIKIYKEIILAIDIHRKAVKLVFIY